MPGGGGLGFSDSQRRDDSLSQPDPKPVGHEPLEGQDEALDSPPHRVHQMSIGCRKALDIPPPFNLAAGMKV